MTEHPWGTLPLGAHLGHPTSATVPEGPHGATDGSSTGSTNRPRGCSPQLWGHKGG